MVFAFLQRRKLRNVFSESCAALLRMQFVISQKSPADNADDPWVLGYLFGASTAILEKMDVDPSPQAYELLKCGYAAIFASPRLGERMLAESMELRANSTFCEGQGIGGSELLAASPGGPVPFALGTYLGDDKSIEIVQQLRKRFLK